MAALPLSKAIVKFNSYSQSRDKIYRTIQYGSRLVLWYFARHGIKGSTEEKLKSLEAALALSRKLFRMGNSMDFIHRAIDALKMPDMTLKNLAIIAHTMKALWLVLDHTIWCSKVKLVQIDTVYWTRQASRAWLMGLAASTVFDLLKLHHLQSKLAVAVWLPPVFLETSGRILIKFGRTESVDQVKLEMRSLRMTFWRDFCDLFIPLSGLEYVNSGVGAFCGLVSSLIGFQQEWEKNIQPYKFS